MMGSVASALIALGLFGLSPQTTALPSNWESDYGRALAATRQAKERPLLVVLDNPADAQHRIEPVGHSTAQPLGGASTSLASYTICRVDTSTAYGQKVAQAFNAESLPHVVIIDKTGRKIIYQASGPMTDVQWQLTLSQHQAGEIPQAAPVSFSQPSYSGSTSCPSCQRGWR